MSEPILNQILEQLKAMQEKQDAMQSQFNAMQSQFDAMQKTQDVMQKTQVAMLKTQNAMQKTQDAMQKRLQAIEAQTADIPLIRRAVLETNEIVKQIDGAQRSFEGKVAKDLATHERSIDILNRRQLKLETAIELINKP